MSGAGGARLLGEAAATAASGDSAMKLYEVYRERKGKLPFDRMRFVEIESDNLENEILNYSIWCSSTPIPRYFDSNLQPKSQNQEGPMKLLVTSTLAKYIGKALLNIRRKFPEHPDFTGLKPNEVPGWWTRMRPQFEKECDKYHLTIGSEFTFGETTVRPLYSNNISVGYQQSDLPINDYVSIIDLQSILKRLMNDATLNCSSEGKLQQRAWLAILYSAVGRGGEVKFIDTADWMYHPLFEVTDIGWTELKTREKYAMPMVPNKKDFTFDFYHSLGSFFAVENGLFRSGDDQVAIQSYLFPDLHGYVDSGVTKKVTAIIRDNLPQGCPKELGDTYSAKSLRKGSITELMTHRSLNGLDVCGRSGHATGTHLDTYADKTFIVRGLRGGKALAQFHDVDANIKVPTLECLGANVANAVEALIDNLFVISVPAFKRSKPLHVVIRICAASLIMHHRLVTSELGLANAVATKLRNAARQAGISDARYPGESPECVLDRWSDIVSSDYNNRNPEIAEATPDAATIATVLNQQTQLMLEMQSDLRELRKDKEQAALRETASQRRISFLENEYRSVQSQLAHANGKLGLLKTPPSRTREREDGGDGSIGGSKSPRLESRSSPSRSSTTTDEAAATLPSPPEQQQQLPPASAARTLVYGAEAKAAAEPDSNKNITISALLVDMYKQGRLTGPSWKDVSVPPKYSEKQMVKNTLELCEYVMSDEEKTALKTTGLSEEALITHSKSVQMNSFRMMWEFEGDDPDTEEKLQKKVNKSQQKKPTYLAIGRRVQEYKKYLAEAAGNSDYNDEKLRPRPTIPDPGTPEGNHSLRRFFGRSSNANGGTQNTTDNDS